MKQDKILCIISGSLYFLSLFLLLMITLPLLAGVFTLIQDSDIVIHHRDYQKRTILMDSLYTGVKKGGKTYTVIGYAKELDDYQTKIKFGQISNQVFHSYISLPEGERDYSNHIYRLEIWYKKGAKYAYPAKKEEIAFPVKKHIERYLDLLPYWVCLFFFSRVCKYVMNKTYKRSRSPRL